MHQEIGTQRVDKAPVVCSHSRSHAATLCKLSVPTSRVEKIGQGSRTTLREFVPTA